VRRESVRPMPQESSIPDLAARVRRLAEFLTSQQIASVRIERGDDEIELRRRPRRSAAAGLHVDGAVPADLAEPRLDAIKAGYVGIFRLGRPAPAEGDLLGADRELGYIEQLGIRNVVHSLGAGRIVTIASADGAAVEYGQPLFLIDRG
jgi:biotin carboxyl carrier protein